MRAKCGPYCLHLGALGIPLGLLYAFPVGIYFLSGLRHEVAEDVGVAPHELGVKPLGHIGQVEVALLRGQFSVEQDLEEQIAELLGQRGVGRHRVRFRSIERGQGVDYLLGLLDEVLHQAGVALLPVPRAPLAQLGDQVSKRLDRRTDGLAAHPAGVGAFGFGTL